jgi:hypothetical protein
MNKCVIDDGGTLVQFPASRLKIVQSTISTISQSTSAHTTAMSLISSGKCNIFIFNAFFFNNKNT